MDITSRYSKDQLSTQAAAPIIDQEISMYITRKMSNDSCESDPIFFSFIDSAIIWTHLYDGLPTHEFGPKIYFVEYAAKALEDPKTEPIAVYHYAGIRRYFWRNQHWGEFAIYAPLFEEHTKELLRQERDHERTLNFRKLLDMLKLYSRSPLMVHQPQSKIADIPFTGKHYTAVIYPIR